MFADQSSGRCNTNACGTREDGIRAWPKPAILPALTGLRLPVLRAVLVACAAQSPVELLFAVLQAASAFQRSFRAKRKRQSICEVKSGARAKRQVSLMVVALASAWHGMFACITVFPGRDSRSRPSPRRWRVGRVARARACHLPRQLQCLPFREFREFRQASRKTLSQAHIEAKAGTCFAEVWIQSNVLIECHRKPRNALCRSGSIRAGHRSTRAWLPKQSWLVAFQVRKQT